MLTTSLLTRWTTHYLKVSDSQFQIWIQFISQTTSHATKQKNSIRCVSEAVGGQTKPLTRPVIATFDNVLGDLYLANPRQDDNLQSNIDITDLSKDNAPPYRADARKNLFGKCVSFDPSQVIAPSNAGDETHFNPGKYGNESESQAAFGVRRHSTPLQSPNGIMRLDQLLSSNRSLDSKVHLGVDIDDSYLEDVVFGQNFELRS